MSERERSSGDEISTLHSLPMDQGDKWNLNITLHSTVGSSNYYLNNTSLTYIPANAHLIECNVMGR